MTGTGRAVEAGLPGDAEGLRDSRAGTVRTAAGGARPRAPVLETGLTLANRWHRFTAVEVTLWAKGHLFGDDFACVARHLAAAGAFEAGAVEDLLQGLDGHWALVAIGPGRAFAAVDRVRSIPLIWARDGESILVDQDGGRVTRWLNITPEDVDRNAALSVALAGYTIGNDTLYSRVRQIGPGEYVLVERPGEVRAGRYHQWTPWRPESGSPVDFAAPLSRLHERLIDKLVESARGRRILVPLSAGFDSRFIASGLREAGYRNVVCFAYGLPGNREALVSRLVAERLGYPWHFVPYGNAAMRRVFANQDHARYKEGADSLTGVHFAQDYLALDALITDGVADPESIVVNGQTGDFITGNHVPAALAVARRDRSPAARQEAIVEALLVKHFRQWGFLRTPANMARLSARLEHEIALIGMPADAGGDHGVYEHCEFQDRQAKYVINGQRLYEHFGLDWRLPFWDRDYLDFWSRVPLAVKVGQALYRQTLVSRNWAGVWGDDVPVNPMRIRPGWLRPIRYTLKALHAPLGRARWHAFERRYLDYWTTPLCGYAIRRWLDVARDGRGHTDPRAFHIESYLSDKGIELEELARRDAA